MNNNLTVKQYIESDSVKERIREVLKNKSSQFIVSLLSAVNSNANLAKCEPQSVMNAAMTAASLDLPINQNLGFAYIIPYGDQAQFQMGVKGFKQLAMRSGMYETINDSDVREGELKGINRLTGELDFNWNTADDLDKLPVIGYLAYFKLKSGYWKMRYMPIEKLQAHGKKYSQTFKKGFGLWKDDFDAMARKTVVKLLLSKDGLLTSELQTAIQADQSVVDDENYKYSDNKKEAAADISEEKEKLRLLKYISESTTIEQLEYCRTSCVTNETADAYIEKEKELLQIKGGKVS